jgi:hypothetical protein
MLETSLIVAQYEINKVRKNTKVKCNVSTPSKVETLSKTKLRNTWNASQTNHTELLTRQAQIFYRSPLKLSLKLITHLLGNHHNPNTTDTWNETNWSIRSKKETYLQQQEIFTQPNKNNILFPSFERIARRCTTSECSRSYKSNCMWNHSRVLHSNVSFSIHGQYYKTIVLILTNVSNAAIRFKLLPLPDAIASYLPFQAEKNGRLSPGMTCNITINIYLQYIVYYNRIKI